MSEKQLPKKDVLNADKMIVKGDDKEPDALWAKLKAIWEAEDKPEIVLVGSQMYRSLTPDGDSNVKFLTVEQSAEQLYATTSTAKLAPAKKSGGKAASKSSKK